MSMPSPSTSRIRAQRAADRLKEATALKGRLQDLLSGSAEAWVPWYQLQSAYRNVILEDLSFAVEHETEQDLWTHVFKTPISDMQVKMRDRSLPGSKRNEIGFTLSVLLETSAGFYLELLQQISTVYKVKLPGRDFLSPASIAVLPSCLSFTTDAPLEEGESSATSETRSDVLYIIQHILVHLGDITRYRDHEVQAQTYYLHATKLLATNGHAYNQLAIVAASKGDRLATLFYYIRAVCVYHRFPAANTNLEKVLEKASNESMDLKGKLSFTEFCGAFLQYCSFLYFGKAPEKLRALSSKLLTSISAQLSLKSLATLQLLYIATSSIYIHHVLNTQSSADVRSNTEGKKSDADSDSATTTTNRQSRTVLINQLLNFIVSFLEQLCTYAARIAADTALIESPTQSPLPAIRVLFNWLVTTPGCMERSLVRESSMWNLLCRILNTAQRGYSTAALKSTRGELSKVDGVLSEGDGKPVSARRMIKLPANVSTKRVSNAGDKDTVPESNKSAPPKNTEATAANKSALSPKKASAASLPQLPVHIRHQKRAALLEDHLLRAFLPLKYLNTLDFDASAYAALPASEQSIVRIHRLAKLAKHMAEKFKGANTLVTYEVSDTVEASLDGGQQTYLVFSAPDVSPKRPLSPSLTPNTKTKNAALLGIQGLNEQRRAAAAARSSADVGTDSPVTKITPLMSTPTAAVANTMPPGVLSGAFARPAHPMVVSAATPLDPKSKVTGADDKEIKPLMEIHVPTEGENEKDVAAAMSAALHGEDTVAAPLTELHASTDHHEEQSGTTELAKTLYEPRKLPPGSLKIPPGTIHPPAVRELTSTSNEILYSRSTGPVRNGKATPKPIPNLPPRLLRQMEEEERKRLGIPPDVMFESENDRLPSPPRQQENGSFPPLGIPAGAPTAEPRQQMEPDLDYVAEERRQERQEHMFRHHGSQREEWFGVNEQRGVAKFGPFGNYPPPPPPGVFAAPPAPAQHPRQSIRPKYVEPPRRSGGVGNVHKVSDSSGGQGAASQKREVRFADEVEYGGAGEFADSFPPAASFGGFNHGPRDVSPSMYARPPRFAPPFPLPPGAVGPPPPHVPPPPHILMAQYQKAWEMYHEGILPRPPLPLPPPLDEMYRSRMREAGAIYPPTSRASDLASSVSVPVPNGAPLNENVAAAVSARKTPSPATLVENVANSSRIATESLTSCASPHTSSGNSSTVHSSRGTPAPDAQHALGFPPFVPTGALMDNVQKELLSSHEQCFNMIPDPSFQSRPYFESNHAAGVNAKPPSNMSLSYNQLQFPRSMSASALSKSMGTSSLSQVPPPGSSALEFAHEFSERATLKGTAAPFSYLHDVVRNESAKQPMFGTSNHQNVVGARPLTMMPSAHSASAGVKSGSSLLREPNGKDAARQAPGMASGVTPLLPELPDPVFSLPSSLLSQLNERGAESDTGSDTTKTAIGNSAAGAALWPTDVSTEAKKLSASLGSLGGQKTAASAYSFHFLNSDATWKATESVMGSSAAADFPSFTGRQNGERSIAATTTPQPHLADVQKIWATSNDPT